MTRGMPMPTARADVTVTTLAMLGRWRLSVALAAPRLGNTDQLNLVCGLSFRFQEPLNHMATGSCGKLPFFGPLQSSQLRRKGMERDRES